jgi:hypothetical protein
MVDPSGGPYITSGMSLGNFGFKGYVVKDFKKINTGYKISEALTGKPKSPQHIKNISKPVAQYDKQGNYITQYNSITEAAQAVSGWDENICQCCKGNKKSSSGYLWKYV